MATLYLIDILDDPNHNFTDVFDQYLRSKNMNVPYYRIDGHHSQTRYDALLTSEPAGIIISGSLQSVYDQTPWMEKLADFIRKAHAKNIPMLGLCFGHQIMAHAMGGTVAPLNSWEFGVHPVFLKGKHPWLLDLPEQFESIQVHQDHVSHLPPEATSLGFSERTPHQIFSMGSLMGVQFHPEYTLDMLHTIVRNRADKLVKKGPFTSLSHLQDLAQHWKSPSLPQHILNNFINTLDLDTPL